MKPRSCRTKFCSLSTRLLPTLLAILAVGGLLFGAQPASAQTCIQDVWKAHGNNQNLTCTANDVTLSKAGNIDISAGGSCDPVTKVCKCFDQQTVTFTADFEMDLTADTRYDVGFYIATDSDPNHDGALTGQCSATPSLASNTAAANFINLDGAPDVCGDITGPFNTAHNPLFVTATISTKCQAGASGKLELPFCTTWRQPGSNQVCKGTGNGTSTNDVFPGSPSKCNCGTLVVDILVETATITVTKTAANPATVPETGGSQVYLVSVKNDSQFVSLTLDSLTDDKYGNITITHLANQSCTGSATPGVCQAVTATTCSLPQPAIPAQQTFSCQFTGTVPPGNATPPGNTFTDVVKACGTDSAGHTNLCDTDDAVVTYTDVASPPTLSKTAQSAACTVDVTYAVVVTNTSTIDTLTLNTLTDNVYGNITQVQGNVRSTTCGVSVGSGGAGILPAQIAPTGNYSCSFVGRITSCNTTVHDTVTGTTVDDDGVPSSPSDDATVTVTVGGLP
jgi:hypothetical protein